MSSRSNRAHGRRSDLKAKASTVAVAQPRPQPIDGATTAPPDIYHVERNEDYLRQLQEEADYWDDHPDTLSSKKALDKIWQYQNEQLTGNPKRQWFEMISDYGKFKRGCVLGAGPGDAESELLRQYEQLHLTIYDISGESLIRLQDRLEHEFPGRTETRQEDLNFVTLPANTYDLFVSNASIHHILNLEHLAFQVNDSLTHDGFFFLRDTVGESFFQFSEEKKRLFQAFRTATAEDAGRNMLIQWPDLDNWTDSPFESVRSGDILDVFGTYLRNVRVGTCSALFELTLFAEPAVNTSRTGIYRIRGMGRLVGALRALRSRLRRKANITRAWAKGDLLIMMDRILSETGYLQPGLAFAIYQKRT
ncbi:MAG: methyltransferase domain-containing protein [Chloroflexi bacterium]|nr:methyltransferase domain-containing protein [Chloroflexota bacterium]